nr:MAG TPA: hypothetical protein [Caudoviricetes sp.]DAG84297.1 MAG TPA: hypothetical protein [Caudoviricetes sp.]
MCYRKEVKYKKKPHKLHCCNLYGSATGDWL